MDGGVRIHISVCAERRRARVRIRRSVLNAGVHTEVRAQPRRLASVVLPYFDIDEVGRQLGRDALRRHAAQALSALARAERSRISATDGRAHQGHDRRPTSGVELQRHKAGPVVDAIAGAIDDEIAKDASRTWRDVEFHEGDQLRAFKSDFLNKLMWTLNDARSSSGGARVAASCRSPITVSIFSRSYG